MIKKKTIFFLILLSLCFPLVNANYVHTVIDGVCVNEDYLYLADDRVVHKYHINGSYAGFTSIDVGGSMQGLAYNDSFYYTTSSVLDVILTTNSTFYPVASDDFNSSSSSGQDIATNGSHIFVTDDVDDMVYVYNSTGAYNTSIDLSGELPSICNPYGISTNLSDLFISCYGTGYQYIFIYTTSGVYQSNFSVVYDFALLGHNNSLLYGVDAGVSDRLHIYNETGSYIGIINFGDELGSGGGGGDILIFEDSIIGSGGFHELLLDWNPTVYPKLISSFNRLFSGSIGVFLDELPDFFLLFVKFLFKQPASIVDLGGVE